MSEIINNIKNLRELTGAGFLDCKKALTENDNNIEKSIDFLRKKGLSKATKKSSREANEGAIGVYINDTRAIMVEINTETDFAAKSVFFLDFLDQIGSYALKVENFDNLLVKNFINQKFDGKLISEYFAEIIAKIGENIVLRKINFIKKDNNSQIYSYTHNAYRNNIGKICVILKAEVKNIDKESNQFGKNLCMHIAASKPLAVDINELDPSLVKKEKEIQSELIKSSGKPENIINKILDGKMKKFYSDVTFLNQPYILDTDKNVKTVISEFSLKNSFSVIEYNFSVLGF